MVVAVLVPLMALAAGYATSLLRLRQDAVEQGTRDSARALSLAVDLDLRSVDAALVALATSPSLDRRDFASFWLQARAVAEPFDGWIVLTDLAMQQVVNTLRPFGEALPKSSTPETMERVINGRSPIVTDLIWGRVAQRQVIALVVPVIRDGTVVYCLEMAFRPDRFDRLLAPQGLPPGWVGVLLDRRGAEVARSHESGRYIGEPPPAQLIEATKQQDEGLVRGVLSNEEATEAAFHKSAATGWTTIVAAPSSVVQAPTRRAALVLAAGGVCSLLLAWLAAVVLGRRIADPLRTLARQAGPMVRGEQVSLPRTGITEVADVGNALVEAAAVSRAQVEAEIGLAEERQARLAAERAHEEIAMREVALRESEERYRALTEAIASIVWTTTSDGFVRSSPGWCTFTGQTPAEFAGGRWLDAVHPDDRDVVAAAWERAVATRASFDAEYRLRNVGGRFRWVDARAVPVLDGDGCVREWIGVCIDVDERKAGAERQALLAAELDHRVRNCLATVQAMIALTAQNASSVEDFGQRLQGRVAAMARTHGLLTGEKWRGASLSRILLDELRAYADDPASIALTGSPECLLRPRQALDFALVIHELATNAAKYGALSRPEGRIVVDWEVREREGDGARIFLEWRESGGPPVREPVRRGFGSRLLESALGGPPDAAVTLDFRPEGLRCRIEMRLTIDVPPSPPARGALETFP